MAFVPSASLSEKRAQVGVFLRNADKYIREGKLDEARIELKRVRDIDPQNAYAMAFEERITAIKAQPAKVVPEPEAKPLNDQSGKLPPASALTPASANQQNVKTPTPVSGPSPFLGKIPSTGAPARPEQARQISPSDTVVRTDIEQKLEEDYKIKFAAEIQKAEQRVADKIKASEEKLEQERALLLDQLQRERSQYRDQMEQEFSKKLQDELAKQEERHREQFEQEKRRVEEEMRSRQQAEVRSISNDYEQAVEHERNSLAAKERQSVAQMKQEIEAEYAGKLVVELEKLKQSTHIKEENTRMEMESAIRAQLRNEYQAQTEKERAAIDQRYQALHAQLEQSFKAQQQADLEEHRRMIEQKLAEVRRAEELKYEQQRIALQQQLEREYKDKADALLTDERRKQEEEIQRALKQAHDEFERERSLLMNQEQQGLEGFRKILKEEMERELAEKLEKASREMVRAYEHKMVLLGVEIPRSKEQKVAVYQNRVREAWMHGPLTMEQAQQLMEIQEILELEFEEHTQCEAEIRLQLYAGEVQKAILSGRLLPSDAKGLEDLKLRYDISPDEAANVEPIILSAFQRIAVKAIIMVVDDDTALLDILAARLQEIGYCVIALPTLSEAMTTVETTSVDLILCDIQFKGEKGDGFTFFKFIQLKPHLRKIPFILMSSLDEGLFIRTGVQLGVDDYLTKPIDIDFLTAVIEGKLKKYRAMSE